MHLGQHGILAGLLLATLGACAPTAVQAPVVAVARPAVATGLAAVMGRNAAALLTQFGTPELDVIEGDARKLQYTGAACVLDAYLYPSAPGREAVVTHVDARLPDGRDIDKASCVAALQAGRETASPR